MEAVRKRPQRAKVAKKRQQQELKDVTVSLSDEEENAAVQAAIAELGAIQETQTTDKEIRRNEDDLLALLQVGERQQEPLLAKGAGSQPPDKDDDIDQEKTGDNEINAQETGKVPVVPVVNGVIAPSAPASEEEGLVAPPEQMIPLQPKPSAPPPSLPTRTTIPRAFHEMTVPVLAGIDVVPPDGEPYARVERYLISEYIYTALRLRWTSTKRKLRGSQLRNSLRSLRACQESVDFRKETVSSSKRCGDNVEIEQSMEFQTAKLENMQLERLKAHLDKLRQLRTVEASMHIFDRAMSYFHVEQYLNRVLQEPDLVSFLNKMSSSCGGSSGIDNLDLVPEGAIPLGSALATSVDHLKYCLDVLVFFEEKVALGEEGVFGRVPQSFYRGELTWHSAHAEMHYSTAGGAGMERKIKCYACGRLNSSMKSNQWCKLCESCDVVLYIPPSSVSTKTNEWLTSVLRFDSPYRSGFRHVCSV